MLSCPATRKTPPEMAAAEMTTALHRVPSMFALIAPPWVPAGAGGFGVPEALGAEELALDPPQAVVASTAAISR